MKRLTGALAALLTITSLGCASRPIPIPVVGIPDVSALVGNWTGEYSSQETGRSGSIVFALKAGKDTAFGSVTMVPGSGVTSPVQGDHQVMPGAVKSASGDLLTIRFVRLQGNEVVGRLDPYRDPDCGCQLTTTFHGAFTDERSIEGTFDTTGSGFAHVPSSGRWRVTRVVN